MRKNDCADLRRARAKRESNTDFRDAFERGIREQSIKTDSRKHQREPGKNGKEKAEQTLRAPGLANAIAHRPGVEDWQRRIDRTNGITNRVLQRGRAGCRSYEHREAGSLGLA